MTPMRLAGLMIIASLQCDAWGTEVVGSRDVQLGWYVRQPYPTIVCEVEQPFKTYTFDEFRYALSHREWFGNVTCYGKPRDLPTGVQAEKELHMDKTVAELLLPMVAAGQWKIRAVTTRVTSDGTAMTGRVCSAPSLPITIKVADARRDIGEPLLRPVGAFGVRYGTTDPAEVRTYIDAAINLIDTYAEIDHDVYLGFANIVLENGPRTVEDATAIAQCAVGRTTTVSLHLALGLP